MDQDVFNMQVRKFLKKVGINAQREIESAVICGIGSGRLQGGETLNATVTLRVPAAGVELDIEDTIALEK